MATNVGGAPLATPRTRISGRSRIYGLGSIYAKTIRDSRLSFIIAAGLLAGIVLVAGAGISNAFATPEARAEIVNLANSLGGVNTGLAGPPVNIGTLGGYFQWKYGAVFAWVAALWSILALSSTLALEARRASLEFVATTPFGRRRIALEKIAAHITVLTLAMAITAVATWTAGAAFGSLPDDGIAPVAAIGFVVWLELMALVFGAFAYALAGVLGRGVGAGIAGFALIVGYLLNNYAMTIPSLQPVANLTPWAWTANHLPLAGQYDWVSLVPLPFVAAVLFLIGTEAFARRDLGATSAVPLPRLPSIAIGLGGPAGRSFGERLPGAIAWGLGIGLFGLFMASLAGLLADQVAQSPDLERVFATMFPTLDITTAGGFIQLFAQLLLIVVGFAAATLVSGWASDEGSGRLEMLITTPLARAAWAAGGGLGVMAAAAVMALLIALGIGIGAAAGGSDVITPMIGTLSLWLYAIALLGMGVAVGSVFRTSIAAEIVALVVVATYLIDRCPGCNP